MTEEKSIHWQRSKASAVVTHPNDGGTVVTYGDGFVWASTNNLPDIVAIGNAESYIARWGRG